MDQKGGGDAVKLGGGVVLQLAIGGDFSLQVDQIFGALVRVAEHQKTDGTHRDQQYADGQEADQQLGVHDASLRVAIAAKPRGKMMLVTDAMPPVGGEREEFSLYGVPMNYRDGMCTTAEGTLAGSALDMASAVRNTVERVGLPLDEACRMASTYPAEFLGLDGDRGRIAPGSRADLVVLNTGLHVQGTWIAGQARSWTRVGAPSRSPNQRRSAGWKVSSGMESAF